VCVCVCMSVCLSHAGIVSQRLNAGWRKQRPRTLVFWRQELLVDDPFPLKFALKVPQPPFKHQNFDQYPLIVRELAKKVQLALIGSRPCAFQRAIDEQCTLRQSPPQSGTKRDFAVFASKIQLLSITSAKKFLCVKTSSSKVVATSFLYLTVHRWIVGDVPIYLKFALRVTHPHRKTPILTDFA